MRRRALATQGRTDRNQGEIVKRYEGWFCSIVDLHGVGFGCSDLLVGINGVNELVEIKTEDGDVRPSQELFAKQWRGRKPVIVRSIHDVDNHVIAVRERLAREKWGRHGNTQETQPEAQAAI